MNDMANSQKPLEAMKKEHRALALLRLLQRESSYCLNDQIILRWFQHLALTSTAEDIRQCAADLEVKGLIGIEIVDAIQVFSLTSDGEDVLWDEVSLTVFCVQAQTVLIDLRSPLLARPIAALENYITLIHAVVQRLFSSQRLPFVFKIKLAKLTSN